MDTVPQGALGLHTVDLEILAALEPASLSCRELADRLALAESVVEIAISRLSDRGYVRVVPGPRRVLALSSRGLQALLRRAERKRVIESCHRGDTPVEGWTPRRTGARACGDGARTAGGAATDDGLGRIRLGAPRRVAALAIVVVSAADGMALPS